MDYSIFCFQFCGIYNPKMVLLVFVDKSHWLSFKYRCSIVRKKMSDWLLRVRRLLGEKKRYLSQSSHK